MASRDELLARAKAGVREKYSSKDLHLIQAVRSLDDIDAAKSLLYTRLSEWFKLNFPELELGNEETYIAFVEAFGSKEGVDKNRLYELVGDTKGGEVYALTHKSFGAALDEADTKAVQNLARSISGLFAARKELENYINEESNKLMPNLSYILEPTIAARLMTAAGGLQKLALMPASTVQVLGAENALFKHLKSGTQPPKHGIIFQSAYVRGEPLERRGRIARALAAKLAIAAKADFFSGNFIAEKLKADLDARVKEVEGLKLAPRRELSLDEEFRRDFGHSRSEHGRPSGNRYGQDRKFGPRPEGGKPFVKPAGGFRKPYGDRRTGQDGGREGSKPWNRGGGKPVYGGKPGGRRPFNDKSRHR
jgi:nucleolar protein 56